MKSSNNLWLDTGAVLVGAGSGMLIDTWDLLVNKLAQLVLVKIRLISVISAILEVRDLIWALLHEISIAC